MHKQARIYLVAGLIALFALCLVPPAGHASLLSNCGTNGDGDTQCFIDIETYVSGNPDLSTYDPITVATLSITAGDGFVAFDLVNHVNNLAGGLGDDAFISSLFLSYSGTTTLTSGLFTIFGPSNPPGFQTISGVSFSPGNEVGYDFALEIDFPEAAVDDRFLDGDAAHWTIADTLIGDFLTLVAPNGDGNSDPSALAMVHIQQVGARPGGGCSLWYVGQTTADESSPTSGDPSADVPGADACVSASVQEPSSVALLGVAILALTGVSVWTRRRRSA